MSLEELSVDDFRRELFDKMEVYRLTKSPATKQDCLNFITDICRIETLRASRVPVSSASADPWQPIETAPKDLSEIIGNFDGIRRVMWWSSLEGWMFPSGKVLIEPTHWAPLPSAPCSPGEEK